MKNKETRRQSNRRFTAAGTRAIGFVAGLLLLAAIAAAQSPGGGGPDGGAPGGGSGSSNGPPAGSSEPAGGEASGQPAGDSARGNPVEAPESSGSSVRSSAPRPAESSRAVLARSPFSLGERIRIRRLIDGAAEAGIPDELLRPRLEEGIAKRVPATRVELALEDEIDRLTTVRAALVQVGSSILLADLAAWARAANLLAADVSITSIQRLAIASADHEEMFRPASALLVSILESGFEEADAVSLAVAATASRLDPDAYSTVLELLTAGRRAGVSVEDVVTELADLLPTVRSARDLRRRVSW